MTQELPHQNAFVDEAQDLLSELEVALLELEEHPEDSDLVDRVFRAMHTIKGSGAMYGFDDISGFTHHVETVFDEVRGGKLKLGKSLLNLIFASRDHIASLLESAIQGEASDLERSQELADELNSFLPQRASVPEETAVPEPPQPAAEPENAIYRIRFKPDREFFLTGANPLALLEELCDLGKAYVFPHSDELPELDSLRTDMCFFWWDVILNTDETIDEIKNVFIFAEDDCELTVTFVANEDDIEEEELNKKLGEILVERGDVDRTDLQRVLEQRKLLGNMLTEAGIVSDEQVESALAEQKAVKDIKERHAKQKAPEVVSSIRVAADKLDYLVDLVGELVIVQAQISQVVGQVRDPVLISLSEELERLSDELRDSTLGIRMLPIGTTFSKFRRLVRDLSAELGKEIELTTAGAETELDKTVIERLNDPLVHLLRNSIDHGVEAPDVRQQSGKSPKGTIHLAAEHSGGDVLIRVLDDGKGINPESIFDKAVERGLVARDAVLTEKEIFSFVFHPGFSTAKQVTNVSGRGVGMDVVKRAIDELRGSIDIHSKPGQGTTITVKLPLTLAIIDGLQIVVGDEYYVIPLSTVEECVELIRDNENDTRERILNLRGEIVPYISLRSWFEVPGERPPIEQVVVVRVQDGRIGLVVDNVIGEHQTVIKSLGKVYKDVEGISGATIKGDGTMALILDIQNLVRHVGQQSAL